VAWPESSTLAAPSRVFYEVHCIPAYCCPYVCVFQSPFPLSSVLHHSIFSNCMLVSIDFRFSILPELCCSCSAPGIWVLQPSYSPRYFLESILHSCSLLLCACSRLRRVGSGFWTLLLLAVLLLAFSELRLALVEMSFQRGVTSISCYFWPCSFLLAHALFSNISYVPSNEPKPLFCVPKLYREPSLPLCYLLNISYQKRSNAESVNVGNLSMASKCPLIPDFLSEADPRLRWLVCRSTLHDFKVILSTKAPPPILQHPCDGLVCCLHSLISTPVDVLSAPERLCLDCSFFHSPPLPSLGQQAQPLNTIP
jgi:hypothetical protein